jgi:hypothetical protein
MDQSCHSFSQAKPEWLWVYSRKAFGIKNFVIARLQSSRGNLKDHDNLSIEITTSTFGLLVMTLFNFHAKIVIARERSDRGNPATKCIPGT